MAIIRENSRIVLSVAYSECTLPNLLPYHPSAAFAMSVMDDVPLTFSCPITGEIFCDPVVISDGHTYERSAILKWLKRNDSSPITREKIAGKSILPNFVVKTLLDEWPKNQLHGNMMDSSIHQVEDGAVVR